MRGCFQALFMAFILIVYSLTTVEVLIICITSLLILILSIIFYILFFKSEAKTLKALLFIDAPDPVNPATAVAIAKHFLTIKTQGYMITDPHLHVILTGRPVNLKTAKASKGPCTSDSANVGSR